MPFITSTLMWKRSFVILHLQQAEGIGPPSTSTTTVGKTGKWEAFVSRLRSGIPGPHMHERIWLAHVEPVWKHGARSSSCGHDRQILGRSVLRLLQGSQQLPPLQEGRRWLRTDVRSQSSSRSFGGSRYGAPRHGSPSLEGHPDTVWQVRLGR